MRVVVRLQVLQFVRMSVGAMFPGMLVSMLVGIARVGMLVRMLMVMLVAVGVGVFVSVRNPIVGVLVGMGMSVFMPMLVTMIVLTFHGFPSVVLVWRKASLTRPSLSRSAEMGNLARGRFRRLPQMADVRIETHQVAIAAGLPCALRRPWRQQASHPGRAHWQSQSDAGRRAVSYHGARRYVSASVIASSSLLTGGVL